ncbi:MAG: acyl-CoA dehydrogenase family protein, partial [Sciscionella sp.]
MTAHTDEESTGEPLDHRQDTHAEVATLRAVLDGRWAPLRGEVRDYLATVAVGDTEQDVATQRGRTWEALHALAGTGVPRIGFPAEFGGKDDVGGALTAFEMLGLGDLSVMVKAGVQWGLFGGAVQLLGTSAHHREYLEKIISLELPGCFAMTETGHGSDVANLATTATFDADTAEFVLDTPVEAARKDYIGNAARDGRMAVVFAQLYTQGRSYGVHAFLVPIRDENGRALPGVRIEDCGAKAGLNGVDNGRLSFHAVRVARTALLNRFGDVTADG